MLKGKENWDKIYLYVRKTIEMMKLGLENKVPSIEVVDRGNAQEGGASQLLHDTSLKKKVFYFHIYKLTCMFMKTDAILKKVLFFQKNIM